MLLLEVAFENQVARKPRKAGNWESGAQAESFGISNKFRLRPKVGTFAHSAMSASTSTRAATQHHAIPHQCTITKVLLGHTKPGFYVGNAQSGPKSEEKCYRSSNHDQTCNEPAVQRRRPPPPPPTATTSASSLKTGGVDDVNKGK